VDDQILRERLGAYVADEPPLALDAASVLAAGRRARRRRLIGGVVGAGGAALAVATILTVVLQGAVGNTTLPTGSPGLSQCVPSPPHAPPQTDRDEYLTCYLADVMSKLLPRATFHRRAYEPADVDGFGTLLPLQAAALLIAGPGEELTEQQAHSPARDDGRSRVSFVAEAVVKDREGIGTIEVRVQSYNPAIGWPTCEEFGEPGDTSVDAVIECEDRTGPRGEDVLATTVAEGKGLTTLRVDVFSGHTWITVSATNFDKWSYIGQASASSPTATDAKGNPDRSSTAQGRPTPMLDMGALVTLATAPELVVFK
jgi:hypothetical protein